MSSQPSRLCNFCCILSLRAVLRMIPTSGEAAAGIRPGEAATCFISGGNLAMRPSNMGIQPAVSERANQSPTAESNQANLPVSQSAAGRRSQAWATSPTGPRPALLRRVNADGDAVPGSQDSELASRARRSLNLGSEETRERPRRLALADNTVAPLSLIQQGRFCCPWCGRSTRFALVRLAGSSD